jgi:hypothetical protein
VLRRIDRKGLVDDLRFRNGLGTDAIDPDIELSSPFALRAVMGMAVKLDGSDLHSITEAGGQRPQCVWP